jgi:hypothetical protein
LVVGEVCANKGLGLAIVFFGSVGFALAVGTLSLHFLAKVKWLASIESAAIGMALLSAVLAFGGTVLRSDMFGFELISVVVFPIALMIVTGVTERWPRFMHVATIPILIFLYCVPAWTDGYAANLHDEYEMQKGVNNTKQLPFAAYSPLYLPTGYSLDSAGPVLADSNPDHRISRAYLILDYSTMTGSRAFSRDAKVFTIHEEARDGDANMPNKCRAAEQVIFTDPCQNLGKSAVGDVYYRIDNDGTGYISAYSESGNTLIELTSKNLSKEEILSLYDSMLPGVLGL